MAASAAAACPKAAPAAEEEMVGAGWAATGWVAGWGPAASVGAAAGRSAAVGAAAGRAAEGVLGPGICSRACQAWGP